VDKEEEEITVNYEDPELIKLQAYINVNKSEELLINEQADFSQFSDDFNTFYQAYYVEGNTKDFKPIVIVDDTDKKSLIDKLLIWFNNNKFLVIGVTVGGGLVAYKVLKPNQAKQTQKFATNLLSKAAFVGRKVVGLP